MLIAWDDKTKAADAVLSAAVGGQLNSVERVRDRRLAAKFEFTPPTASQNNIFVDFPSANQPIQLVAFLGMDAQNFEIQVEVVDGFTSLYDSGTVTPWAPPAGSGITRSMYFILPEEVSADQVRFQFDTLAANTPIKIGRIWCGPIWQPKLKAQFQGFSAGVLDPSRVVESQGGQIYTVDRARRRTLRMALTLPESEAIGTAADPDNNAQSLLFEAGNSGSVIVVPTTEGATAAEREHLLHRLSVYGIIQRSSDLELLDRANVSGSGSERLYRLSLDVLEQL